MRLTGQVGVTLGERLKSAWEWAAVLGQVEVYGWDKVDLRFAMIRGEVRG
jgi:hypothetical protein